ncbi:MAG: hypothetical protein ACOCWG_02070 [bacterium]
MIETIKEEERYIMENDKGLMTEEKDLDKETTDDIPLTRKDMKAMKRSRYSEKSDGYKYTFVVKNKKTGQIAELNASSPLQATNFIGWRPRHVKILETKINTKNHEGEH